MSKLLVNILKQGGAEVVVRDDALDVPAVLAQERFDIIVFDWAPLDQNPEPVLKSTRAAARRTPILVASAMARSPAFQTKAKSAGATELAPKPYQLTDLMAMLDRVLTRHAT
jgi:DNA-binding response OmpR family regulator